MTDSASPTRKADIGSAREQIARIYRWLMRARPRTRGDLKNYVKAFLGITIPDRAICPEHNSPMDYLWHTFSADGYCHSERNEVERRIRPVSEDSASQRDRRLIHPQRLSETDVSFILNPSTPTASSGPTVPVAKQSWPPSPPCSTAPSSRIAR